MCHQAHGLGTEGPAAPLLDPEWVGCGTHPEWYPSHWPHGQTPSLPTQCHPTMLGTQTRFCRPGGSSWSCLSSQWFKVEAWDDFFFFLTLFFVFALSLTFTNRIVKRNAYLPRYFCGPETQGVLGLVSVLLFHKSLLWGPKDSGGWRGDRKHSSPVVYSSVWSEQCLKYSFY